MDRFKHWWTQFRRRMQALRPIWFFIATAILLVVLFFWNLPYMGRFLTLQGSLSLDTFAATFSKLTITQQVRFYHHFFIDYVLLLCYGLWGALYSSKREPLQPRNNSSSATNFQQDIAESNSSSASNTQQDTAPLSNNQRRILYWLMPLAAVFDLFENVVQQTAIYPKVFAGREIHGYVGLGGGFATVKWIFIVLFFLMAFRRELRSVFRQVRHFRYGLFFSALTLVLPLIVLLRNLTHSEERGWRFTISNATSPEEKIFDLPFRLVGGLFSDITWLEAFLIMFGVSVLVLAVILCQALIVDGIPRRYGQDRAGGREEKIFDRSDTDLGFGNGYIALWLDSNFGFPISRCQKALFLLYCLVWLFALWEFNLWSVAVLGPGLVGMALPAIILFYFGQWLDSDGANWPWISETFPDFKHAPHRLIAVSLFVFVGVYGLLLAVVLLVANFLSLLPSLFFILILLIVLSYMFGLIEFWFPTWGFPVTALVVAVFLGGAIVRSFAPLEPYTLEVSPNQNTNRTKIDLLYRLNPLPQSTATPDSTQEAEQFEGQSELMAPLDPKEDLVVVAVSGGGILSAAWSTYWLREIYCFRPELAEEIRFVSSVSGGSVGMAQFLTALKRGASAEDPCGDGSTPTEAQMAAAAAHDDAKESSLRPVTVSLAYPDLWRGFNIPNNFRGFEDRGRSIETEWMRQAGITNDKAAYSLSAFEGVIKQQQVPGFAFNATVLETGRRLMITPLSFEGIGAQRRAQTVNELWDIDAAGTKLANGVDMNIFTAARASATFPYVSPAAQSLLGSEGAGRVAYHLLDGGYNDNFGIQTSLDFLRPLLACPMGRDKELNCMGLKRILIVEMRLTDYESELQIPKKAGNVQAELLGPALGFFNVSQKAQIENNNIDLAAFVTAADEVGMAVEVLTIQPDETVSGPLSWLLPEETSHRLFNGRYMAKVSPKCLATRKTDPPDCSAAELVLLDWPKVKVSNSESTEYVNCLEQMSKFLSEGTRFPQACVSRKAILSSASQ